MISRTEGHGTIMAFGKTAKDPFGTTVGHLVDIHTSSTTKSEDWGQFMNICDVINSTADGSRDAVRALKKRLRKNYNQKEVRYTLSLLEMCMQNCNTTFQSLVLKKEFCKDMLVKLLNPKYNLPINLQNRILRFIMTWSTQSQGNVDLTEVKELYLEMIKKGIQFPPLDANEGVTAEMQRVEKQTISDRTTTPSCTETTTQQLLPEQIGKLYSELDMVRMNVRVMSEILLENAPGAELPQDMDLLQELEKVCREMQARILKLLEIVQNEDVIIELVQVNDDLNNIFLRHTRFLRNRSNQLTNDRQDHGVLGFLEQGSAEVLHKSNGDTTAMCEHSLKRSSCPFLKRSPPSNQLIPRIGINQPTAPSSELIDLGPMPGTHPQTNGHPPPAAAVPVSVPNLNPQQAPNFDTGSTEPPPPPYHNMYPQMDLLELKEAANTPFPYGGQNQLPRLPLRNLYDNAPYPPFPPAIQTAAPFFPRVPASTPFFPLAQHPAPLLPTVPISTPPLLAETNSSLFSAVPTLSPTVVPLPKEPANRPPDTSNRTPLPNYYELLEFDPLADSNKTEVIYEEIDTTSWKSKNSSC